MPITGYLEIDRKSLYVQTIEKRIDTTSLSLNPRDANALTRGEWLTLDQNKWVRPGATSTSVDSPSRPAGVDRTYYPALRGAFQLDVQAAQGPVSALANTGAIIRTDMYATKYFDAVSTDTAITYTVDQDLVVALAYDANGNLKSVLAPAGLSISAPTDTAEGRIAALDTTVVARVVRPPYSLTGTGTDMRKLVMDVKVL